MKLIDCSYMSSVLTQLASEAESLGIDVSIVNNKKLVVKIDPHNQRHIVFIGEHSVNLIDSGFEVEEINENTYEINQ